MQASLARLCGGHHRLTQLWLDHFGLDCQVLTMHRGFEVAQVLVPLGPRAFCNAEIGRSLAREHVPRGNPIFKATD